MNLDEIAEEGCCVCNRHYGVWSPACLHHVRRLATSKKRDKAPVIPLCYHHHQGKEGIHTIGRKTWEEKFGDEMSYLRP